MTIKLMVYGSLLNPGSASAGIGRAIEPENYHDIQITGYALNFNVLETVIVSRKELQVCFLNLTEDENMTLQAKYLLISEDELQRLMVREKNYHLINVKNSCSPCFYTDILTFVGTPEHLISPKDKPLILERYIRKITKGVQLLNSSFAKDFLSCLEETLKGSQVILGDYRFSSPLQNSMTDYIEAR